MTSDPKTVLVVEDEAILALELEFVLSDHGYRIVGPAGRLESGIEMAETAVVDAALLDLNLHGKSSDPIADRLAERNIPFLFLSGHTRDVLSERHCNRPLLSKPFVEADLVIALRQLLG
ncbi:response regulator [Sulfitobacter sp. HNIBRBA3233]|uniref:response regulator n=1 Tax=Sulfitobacter marinivivus TaxID=3158558 RepID=UPI0032E005B5